jgi:hypothetical protein
VRYPCTFISSYYFRPVRSHTASAFSSYDARATQYALLPAYARLLTRPRSTLVRRSSGSHNGLAVGLGVGIPLACILWFCVRPRIFAARARARERAAAEPFEPAPASAAVEMSAPPPAPVPFPPEARAAPAPDRKTPAGPSAMDAGASDAGAPGPSAPPLAWDGRAPAGKGTPGSAGAGSSDGPPPLPLAWGGRAPSKGTDAGVALDGVPTTKLVRALNARLQGAGGADEPLPGYDGPARARHSEDAASDVHADKR